MAVFIVIAEVHVVSLHTHLFEDIEVKQNAPQLLEKALLSKKNKCMIATGSMSDQYMREFPKKYEQISLLDL